jgi:hypothetical protein
VDPDNVACAAKGMEQLPPMARLTARSAATANQEVEWAKGFKASIKSARPVQISIPKAP